MRPTSPVTRLITTPIFYVNAEPHIGHVYSALTADALKRWINVSGKSKDKNEQAWLLTGTDEHGLKISNAAAKDNLAPIDFCNNISKRFQSCFDDMKISYDDFIRTTEQRHIETVNEMWKTLVDKGFIYKGKYEGWYSVPDEAFLRDSQVFQDPVTKKMKSKESGHVVDWVTETNYMFKLSHFREKLQTWIADNKNGEVISPSIRKEEMLNYIKDDLPDISVSRPTKRVSWAIPVPNDPEQSIYVWLDALTNYLSASKHPSKAKRNGKDAENLNLWPAQYHIIGKDILKFHALYWPAFLMAADYPLPKKIVAHSHWTVDGVKMSKSLGNIIKPQDIIQKYGVDAVRYFLLRAGGLSRDGDFSHIEMVNQVNAEFINLLGNLASRTVGKAILPSGQWPENVKNVDDLLKPFSNPSPDNDKFLESLNDMIVKPDGPWNNIVEKVDEHYKSLNFMHGIQVVIDALQATNREFALAEPWRLRKQPEQKEKLDKVVYLTLESLRIAGILLLPIIPDPCSRLLTMLNIPQQDWTTEHCNFGKYEGTKENPRKLPLNYPKEKGKFILSQRLELPSQQP